MAVTHGTALRGTLAQAVLDAVGGAGGKFKVKTSGGTTLATFSLANPAYTRSGAVLTLAGVPISATAAATGTAAIYEVTTTADVVLHTGSIATSGGDITIDNTSITSGQTVNLNSHTYTAPA